MKTISRIMNIALRSIVLVLYAYTVFMLNIPAAGEPVAKLDKTLTVKGIEFILVPAGEFVMGSKSGEGNPEEQPQHTVYLDAYYISKYEITNKQYADFLNAIRRHIDADEHKYIDLGDGDELIELVGEAYRPKDGFAKHPVVEVSWYGAQAFCKWLRGNLPTEAQWEKAARGTDGRRWPWGNEYKPTFANLEGDGDGYTRLAPAGSFPKGISPYGIYDMAGNVWEWCLDWYDGDFYRNSPRKNPVCKNDKSGFRVIRGGGWNMTAASAWCSKRVRDTPDTSTHVCGFRPVINPLTLQKIKG